MKRTTLVACLLVVGNWLAFRAPAAPEEPVFPGKAWETKRPEEVGLSRDALAELAAFIGGRGCVVRHGFLIHTWGDVAKRSDVASACKPVFTHFLLVAIEKETVHGLDEKLTRWKPELGSINAERGHKDREITWRHVANQISCYGVTERPGEAYDYNDYNMTLFFDTLFLDVYETSWDRIDRDVLRPLLTDRVGCEDEPTFMAFGLQNRPGRLGISPRDFARFGLLYLRGGQWRGERLIGAEHVRRVTTTPVESSVPRTEGRDAEMLPKQRSLGGGKNQTDHMGSYSYAWWTNGVDREGKRHWADAPEDTFGAFGHGGLRAMVVLPSLDLIISWNDSTVNSRERENRALDLLVDSVTSVSRTRRVERDPPGAPEPR